MALALNNLQRLFKKPNQTKSLNPLSSTSIQAMAESYDRLDSYSFREATNLLPSQLGP